MGQTNLGEVKKIMKFMSLLKNFQIEADATGRISNINQVCSLIWIWIEVLNLRKICAI